MRRALVRFACVALTCGTACQAFLSFGDQVVVVYADGGAVAAPDGGDGGAGERDGGGTGDGNVGTDAAALEDAGPPQKLEVLATGQAGPRTLALNSGYVYWANANAGTIGLYAKDGGASLLDAGVAPNDSTYGSHAPRFVAADESNVYWAMPTGGSPSTPGIRVADVDGGTARDLLAPTDLAKNFQGFTQQGDYLYWTTNGTWVAVVSLSKNAGTGSDQFVAGGSPPLSSAPGPVVATKAEVFWTLPGASEISSSSLVGMQKITDNTPAPPSSLAADERYVYFIAGGQVWRRDAATLANQVAIAQDANAVELAAYGGYVYWTFAVNGNGGVRRIRSDIETDAGADGGAGAGAAELLHDQLPQAHWIAVDESGVYFTRDNGEVCRLVR